MHLLSVVQEKYSMAENGCQMNTNREKERGMGNGDGVRVTAAFRWRVDVKRSVTTSFETFGKEVLARVCFN